MSESFSTTNLANFSWVILEGCQSAPYPSFISWIGDSKIEIFSPPKSLTPFQPMDTYL